MKLEWDDIAETVRLDEVLDALGIHITGVNRNEHISLCPLHTERVPSFAVNDESLEWNCYVCGGGPLPLLVVRIEGLEDDENGKAWQKALQWLIPFSDYSSDEDELFMKQLERYLGRAESHSKRQREVILPSLSPLSYQKLPEAPVALFDKWKIKNQDTVSEFDIRYSPERVKLGREGLDPYSGPALLIPHWFNQNLVGVLERWMSDDRPKWVPKYTNSKDMPKRETLFSWDRAMSWAKEGIPIIIVESSMTVVRLWELGYGAVCTFGSAVNLEQIRLLANLHSGVIISPDNEKGGKKGYTKLANKLATFIPVYMLEPVENEKGDLADLEDHEIHKALDKAKTYV